MLSSTVQGPDARRARLAQRGYALRLAAALALTLVVLQAADWYAATRLTREVLVEEQVASLDSFSDLLGLLAAGTDVEGFGSMLDGVTAAIEAAAPDPDTLTGQGDPLLASSWHAAGVDRAMAGPVDRTALVDAALERGARQFAVHGNRLEHVGIMQTLEGPVAFRTLHEMTRVSRASARLRTELARNALLGILAATVMFFAVGGRRLVRDHGHAVRLGHRDPLTGLANHRSFPSDLDRAVADAARTGAPLALIVFDVDRFKQINDDRGHQAGDDALRALGRIATGSRAGDRAYRLGGDEFALIAPGTDVTAAQVLADRLREEVRTDAGITVSVGIAIADGHHDGTDVYRRADRALYAAKRSGRDIAVLAEAPAA